eukprot:m.18530 g.18530  ORF g.18530 m.18530 type:complete len:137 (+) comp7899_c0_seq1:73-483(+)
MGRPIKDKKVVIMLNGRYAGKKAVVVSHADSGDGNRKYGHCLVAGLSRVPRKITKRMSDKQKTKRTSMKPFLKVVNFNHIMPTRYSFDAKLNPESISKGALKDAAKKRKALREIKLKFRKQFQAGDNRWFFSKLRF